MRIARNTPPRGSGNGLASSIAASHPLTGLAAILNDQAFLGQAGTLANLQTPLGALAKPARFTLGRARQSAAATTAAAFQTNRKILRRREAGTKNPKKTQIRAN
jgi:hypothetical protein